jgi:hypothetical protein
MDSNNFLILKNDFENEKFVNFDDFLIILVLGLSFICVQLLMFYYSSVWNKHRGTFINFVAFFQGLRPY